MEESMLLLTRAISAIILITLIISGCGQNFGDISNDQLLQKIEERIAYRSELIKDFSCELFTTRLSDSPRGEMKSEMKYAFYKKMPDKIKTEFIEGLRNGEKISKEDFANFGNRRPNLKQGGQSREGQRRDGQPRNGRGRGMFNRGRESQFDLTKYLSGIKLIAAEKVDTVFAYKAKIKISDKKDRLKEVTLWIDKTTFDVIKLEGEYRKGERIESGSLSKKYAPVGPEGAWMLTENRSETFMVFDTPMGEFEMESLSTSTYSNYLFNLNLSDSLFVEDK